MADILWLATSVISMCHRAHWTVGALRTLHHFGFHLTIISEVPQVMSAHNAELCVPIIGCKISAADKVVNRIHVKSESFPVKAIENIYATSYLTLFRVLAAASANRPMCVNTRTASWRCSTLPAVLKMLQSQSHAL